MKINLRAITLAVAIAILPNLSSAREWEVGLDLDFSSAYVWRGITLNDEEVLQPSVTVSSPQGLSLNVWANYDVDDYGNGVRENDVSEIDFTASYDLPVEIIRIQVGVVNYSFHRRDNRQETREAFLRAAKELFSLDIIAEAYYDFDEIDDYYLSIGVGRCFEFTDHMEMQVAATTGYAGDDFAPGGQTGWHDYTLSLGLNYEVADHIMAGTWLAFTDTLHRDVLPEQDVDLYYGLHVGYRF